MAAGDACVDPTDLAIGHELGLFQCLLNALHGSVNVDNDAALEAAAGRNAQAGEFELAALQHFGHHHHHFAGTDVEADNQFFVFFGHSSSTLISCLFFRRRLW